MLAAAPAASATPCDYTTRIADMNIPDGVPAGPLTGGGATSSFWVPPPDFQGDGLTDVDIRVDIQHPIDSDVDITVTHGGKTVVLSSDNGAGANYTGTTFDDEATTSVTGAASPFTGSFKPEQPLSAFDGVPAQGVWTITVSDDTGTLSGGGGGGPVQKLISWGLDYSANQCKFSMPPCDEHGSTFDTTILPNSTSTISEGTTGNGMVSDVDVYIHRYSFTSGTVDFAFGRWTSTTVMRDLAHGMTPSLIDTVFSDGSPALGAPPYTGTFGPEQGLTFFNGASASNAQWRFEVHNHNVPDGKLGRWGIRVMIAGDGCTDPDGDVILSTSDNCPSVSNLAQQNYEGDLDGDICDADDDNDGVADTADACPMGLRSFDVGGTSPDYDADGCKDPEDADDDADGVADSADACPQAIKGPGGDTDGDGCKDFEDADDDNDGVADTADKCPLTSDAAQTDTDADGVGDACDPDDDGDGVVDGADAFPLDPTRSKVDTAPPPSPSPSPPLPPQPKAAPVLSKLKLSATRFAAANLGGSVAAKRKKVVVGTTVTYAADIASATTFTVSQSTRGVKKGKKCVKRTRGAKGKACTLLVVKGTFSRLHGPGTVRFTFTGRVASGKKTKALAPGSYVLTVQGRNAKGAGKALTAKFTIVKS